jgi:hypothetical protein
MIPAQKRWWSGMESIPCSKTSRFSFDGRERHSSIYYGWWANAGKNQQKRQSGAVSRTILCMGKGDGKKKRKKLSAVSSSLGGGIAPASSSNSQQQQQYKPPARVSTNINISVRRQIAYANLNKQYRAAQFFTRQGPAHQVSSHLGRGGSGTKSRRTSAQGSRVKTPTGVSFSIAQRPLHLSCWSTVTISFTSGLG